MSGQIFISYRRDDSSAWAGRLYDRLSSHFASNHIFMDVDSLDLGIDFVKAIEGSVGSCDVLIAVIGARWLISFDEKRRRRLDNPEDFVRIEIATALKRDIRVIPVLVDGASMPQSIDLPDDLKALVRRNALEVSHNRFRTDLERLMGAVERALAETPAERRESEQARSLGSDHLSTLPGDWRKQAGRYMNAKDYAKALPLLEKAAHAGDTNAMNNLGVLYQGVAQDYGKAREWYQKAAHAGNAVATNNLGLHYQNGQGVAQDYGKAREWYQRAAHAGNPAAMNNLGWLYDNGCSVAQDYGKAREWYQKAAHAGDKDAMHNLGLLYENGWGVAQDYGKARERYQKAAHAGHTDAEQALSRLH